jgi:hypothetical protein
VVFFPSGLNSFRDFPSALGVPGGGSAVDIFISIYIIVITSYNENVNFPEYLHKVHMKIFPGLNGKFKTA